MITVLIPAYEPDEQLITLTRRLKEVGFSVLVVDDGSGEKYRHIFNAVRENAHVLTHPNNRGKGAALKTGMTHMWDCMPESRAFITCDADGQHTVEDVLRVAQMLRAGHHFVLTMRKPHKDVPLRSKVGNSMSRVVYALLTNRYLLDNQSGLRGFSRVHIDWMVQIEEDRYDYEMNMLYFAAKKGIRVSTMMIEAIYIGNNESSHFHPIKDTLRIYRSLFRLAIGLFIGFFVAELCVIAASIFFNYEYLMVTLPTVGLIAYATNIFINHFIVFKGIQCYDQVTLLIHQIIAFNLYTFGCLIFRFVCPQIPLWAAFNIVYLVCLPVRYWFHKYTYIAQRTRE